MRLERYIINEKSMPISAIRNTIEYKRLSPKLQKEFETIWKKIKNDCQPFLKQLMKQSASNLLYRNMDVKNTMGNLNVRMDRKPRDTPKVVHKIFDDILEDVYGYRARSKTIFCSGNENWGGAYGYSYVIFPKGPFKFLWSENVKDSYDFVGPDNIKRTIDYQYEKEAKEIYKGNDFNFWLNQFPDKIRKNKLKKVERELVYKALEYGILERIDYKEDNLIKALKSKHEIMIFCKDYYYLSTYNYYLLIKLLLWGDIKNEITTIHK